jgi:cysteine desulfurase
MIYLDSASSTPILKEVIKEMKPFLEDHYANPSSKHKCADVVKPAIDLARERVSNVINSGSEEVIFTSGATESINLAIKGIITNYSDSHIITTQIEHKAVLESCKYLESIGVEVTYLGVDQNGVISLDELKSSIQNNTVLISVQFANNEIGTIQDVESIGKICKENNIPFMCDVTQVIGKLEVDVERLNIDLLCLSSHKIHGPKGVGALYKRKKIKLTPLLHGGDQEGGLRAGTLNTAGIVGFGKACEIAKNDLGKNHKKLSEIQAEFESFIESNNKGQVIAKNASRLPHISNIQLNEEADTFINRNKGTLCVSTGSACNSNIITQSLVLKAIGMTEQDSKRCVRFSFSNSPLGASIWNTIFELKQVDKK